MYSTVDDLYLWDRALRDGKILKKESLEQMNKKHSPDSNYGYGVFLDDMNGQKCVSHMGTLPGINTLILRFVDEDTCIIILSNLTHVQLLKMQSNLYSILHEGKYEKPEQFKEINMDSKLLDSYTGKYELAPGINFEIVKRDSGLSFVTKCDILSPNETSTLYACSENKFFHKFKDLNVEFKDIENGKAQKAILNLGGMPAELKRIN